MAKPRIRPIAKTFKVNSFNDFISSLDHAQEELKSDNLWFRGHESSKWKLIPSVYRGALQKNPDIRKTISVERNLFVRFQNAAYSRASRLPDQKDVSKWLCLMRHYGLPTRLLDWSKSPLIAAFFACREMPFKTPTIWVLNPLAINTFYETVAPVLMLRDETPDVRLANHLKDILNHKSEEDSVLAVLPPEIDNRLLSQKSAFTIHGTTASLQNLRIGKPFLVRIRISSSGATSIKRALKLLHYEASNVFPDLDHLADELRRNYHV